MAHLRSWARSLPQDAEKSRTGAAPDRKTLYGTVGNTRPRALTDGHPVLTGRLARSSAICLCWRARTPSVRGRNTRREERAGVPVDVRDMRRHGRLRVRYHGRAHRLFAERYRRGHPPVRPPSPFRRWHARVGWYGQRVSGTPSCGRADSATEPTIELGTRDLVHLPIRRDLHRRVRGTRIPDVEIAAVTRAEHRAPYASARCNARLRLMRVVRRAGGRGSGSRSGVRWRLRRGSPRVPTSRRRSGRMRRVRRGGRCPRWWPGPGG
jgi:hypothetical protein